MSSFPLQNKPQILAKVEVEDFAGVVKLERYFYSIGFFAKQSKTIRTRHAAGSALSDDDFFLSFQSADDFSKFIITQIDAL